MKKRLLAALLALWMALAPLTAVAAGESSPVVGANKGTLPTLSFTTTTLDGKSFSGSVLKNYDLILVNCWGSWCYWCGWEMPYLQQISEKYKNVLVLGLWDEYGSVQDALDTAAEAGVTYPLIRPNGTLNDCIAAVTEGWPTTFFFDSKGKQVGEAEVGAMSFDGWDYVVQEKLASLPPRITTQPKAVTVAAGEKATFKVVAARASSYQWQYLKPDASSWTNVSSNGTSATYTLTAAAKHNGYTYRCRVKNANGTVYSSKVKLTVQSKPVITTQPVAVTTTVGQKATFTVAATGATAYKWQYQKKGESTWNDVKTNGTSATYTLTVAAKHDGYVYRCQVENAAGSVYSSTAKLTVNPGGVPAITTQPVAVTVTAGQKATFKVVAPGATSYKWQYRKPGSTTWTDVKANGTSATYSLTAELRHDGYTYRCQVQNASGSVYSALAKLTVIESAKPTITTQPKSVTVDVGKKATFKVVATGAESYKWQYQKPGSSSWIDVKTNGTAASYSLTTEARHNGYKYRCEVQNAAGVVYSSTVTLGVRRYIALLIGNGSGYTAAQPLKAAPYDVKVMKALLKGLSPAYTVTVKENQTADEMLSAISSVFAGTTSNDVCLFYYTGHGDNGTSYYAGSLCGIDCDGRGNGLVTPSELASALGSACGGKVIVLLDSCGSGASIYAKGGTTNSPEAFTSAVIDVFRAQENGAKGDAMLKTGELRTSKYYVMAACEYGQTSVEYTWVGSYSFSLFTSVLAEAAGCEYPNGTNNGKFPGDADGNKVLTLGEAYDFVCKGVEDDGASQKTQVYGDLSYALFRRK